jgi:hypothetical protein
MYTTCSLCGSAHLIPNVRVHDDGTGWGYSAKEHYVTVASKPHAFLDTGKVSSQLLATICGACGYTVFFVADPQLLYAAYQQAKL